MKRASATVFLLSVALSTAVALEAGTNSWTAVGPPDVTGYFDFVITPHGDALYVAAFGYPGLWRSRDRGAGWELLGQGTALQQGLVTRLAIDANNRNHLVAMSRSRLFHSFNGGDSWTAADLPVQFAKEFATSSDLTTIYIGSEQTCVTSHQCSGGSVHRSSDGGKSWSGTGLNGLSTGLLKIDPRDSRIVYATAVDYERSSFGVAKAAALFRTRDGGRNWSRIGPAVVINQSVGVVPNSHLFIDPAAPSNLLLSTETGLWTSADGGDRWVNTQTTAVFSTITGFATDPLDAATIFAATPGAAPLKISCPPTVPPLPPALPGVPNPPLPPTPPCPPPTPPPAAPNVLFGVLRTSDYGQTWTRFIGAGIPETSDLSTRVDLVVIVTGGLDTFYQIRRDGLYAYTLAGPRRRAVKP